MINVNKLIKSFQALPFFNKKMLFSNVFTSLSLNNFEKIILVLVFNIITLLLIISGLLYYIFDLHENITKDLIKNSIIMENMSKDLLELQENLKKEILKNNILTESSNEHQNKGYKSYIYNTLLMLTGVCVFLYYFKNFKDVNGGSLNVIFEQLGILDTLLTEIHDEIDSNVKLVGGDGEIAVLRELLSQKIDVSIQCLMESLSRQISKSPKNPSDKSFFDNTP